MGGVQSQLSTDWTRGEGKEPSDAITAIRWRRRRGGFIKSWHRSIITNNNGRETNQDRHRGISIIIQISRYIGNNYTQTRSPATRGTRRRGIHSIESIGFIESVTNNNTNTVGRYMCYISNENYCLAKLGPIRRLYYYSLLRFSKTVCDNSGSD